MFWRLSQITVELFKYSIGFASIQSTLTGAHILMHLGLTLAYFIGWTTDHSNEAEELETASGGFSLARSGELVCAKLKLYGMRLQEEACMPHLFIMFFLFLFFLFFLNITWEACQVFLKPIPFDYFRLLDFVVSFQNSSLLSFCSQD